MLLAIESILDKLEKNERNKCSKIDNNDCSGNDSNDNGYCINDNIIVNDNDSASDDNNNNKKKKNNNNDKNNSSNNNNNDDDDDNNIVLTYQFLNEIYPALKEWTLWFLSSQRGPSSADGKEEEKGSDYII